MNARQMSERISAILKAHAWSDGSQEVVFGTRGVFVTAGLAEEAIGRVRLPCAIVRPTTETPDEESPELLTQQFEVILICVNQSDTVGEHTMLDGPRSSGVGSSGGAGILRLATEVKRALGQLDRTDGVSLKYTHASGAEASFIGGHGYVATQTLVFEAFLHREPSYLEALSLIATDGTDGTVALTWVTPTTADDVIVRRASGSTAPATIASGDAVASGSVISSYTDSPGAGTFSYSVFVGYDTTGDGSVDTYSSATSVTVTVTNAVITANLLADLDGRVGVTDTGGGFVSAWANQAAANDPTEVTQGTSADRPTTTTINSLAALLFSGTAGGKFMTAATLAAGAYARPASTGMTVYQVVEITAASTALSWSLEDTGSSQRLALIYNGTGYYVAALDGSGSASSSAVTLGVSTRAVIVARIKTDGTLEVRLNNGTWEAVSRTVDPQSLDLMRLGTNSGSFDEKKGRLLFYGAAHSDGDVTTVVNALASVWGVTV